MFYLVGLASRYGLGTRVQKKKRWFMNKISLLMPRGLGDAFFSPKDASSKQRTGERRKRTRGRKGRKKGKKGGGRSFQGSRKMVVNKFREKLLASPSGHRRSIQYESIPPRWGWRTLVTFQSN